jgi:putative ATP-dependent endonuclease of OLD family
LEVFFRKGLNVLIGENNIWKTAIIDALCIALWQGKSEYTKREIYLRESDFHITKDWVQQKKIEIHLYFQPDTEDDKSTLFEAKRVEEDDYHICFCFELDENPSSRFKIKSRIWWWVHEENIIASSLLDNLHFTFLDALRDAENSLAPNVLKGTKIWGLYDILTKDTPSKRKDIPEGLAKELEKNPEWQKLLNEGKTQITSHLDKIVTKWDEKWIEFEPIIFEFQKLVNSLELKTITGKFKFSIEQNGLGFNNLLYVSVILASLQKQVQIYPWEYLSLLVEEPEAHLHPQLQNIFFEYLNSIADTLGYQIFVTSHSPTITAKADINSIIVLSEDTELCACWINEMGLPESAQKFLQKFLDVTKSQLFYAKWVILVEWIAEALLLQSFSELLWDKYNLEKNGIEIVNIWWVSFSHFMSLFSSPDKQKRLQMKCAVLTDDDEWTDSAEWRIENLKKLEWENVKVFTSSITFEYQLYVSQISQKAKDTLTHIFSHIHSKLTEKLLEKETVEEQGKFLAEALDRNRKKSEFAFQLASCSLEDREFTVPEYIQNAIKYAIWWK